MKKIFLIGALLVGMGARVYAKPWAERWKDIKTHVTRHKDKYIAAATAGFGLAGKVYGTKKSAEWEQNPLDNENEQRKKEYIWNLPEVTVSDIEEDIQLEEEENPNADEHPPINNTLEEDGEQTSGDNPLEADRVAD